MQSAISRTFFHFQEESEAFPVQLRALVPPLSSGSFWKKANWYFPVGFPVFGMTNRDLHSLDVSCEITSDSIVWMQRQAFPLESFLKYLARWCPTVLWRQTDVTCSATARRSLQLPAKKIGLKKKDRRVRTELDGYIVTPPWPLGNY